MEHHSFDHWPPDLAHRLTQPHTNLFYNVEVSAARYPDKPFLIFYDTPITFGRFKEQAERIAGFLQRDCGVESGDRVLLYMQNSPQWVLAYYGILRANAVVVPINPMCRKEELRHFAIDSGARVAFVGQELLEQVGPLKVSGDLDHLIVATYSDYLEVPTDLVVPSSIAEPRREFRPDSAVPWHAMMKLALRPGPLSSGLDDLCVMPYTSGTTGRPKGCMHTHRSVMNTTVGGCAWFGRNQDDCFLSVLPYFHVTGMVGSMNGPMYLGATVVLLPRWDSQTCAHLIERHRVTVWQCISTMVVDFLADPKVSERDLSSLRFIRGGGAAMPEAVAVRLMELTGLRFVEGYGMSETISATHINPPQRPKPQCLGIPVFDVDARILEPDSTRPVPRGEIGEIVISGPQLMQGYWKDKASTEDAFVRIEGKRFLRTGDLGRVDEEGYFFMVDRLKRMINAAGFKVWPAEVESTMYEHPEVLECCVVGVQDSRRGETVKAFVVRKPSQNSTMSSESLTEWLRSRLAAYKCPRIIEFVPSLPKSGSGKIQWRALQEVASDMRP